MADKSPSTQFGDGLDRHHDQPMTDAERARKRRRREREGLQHVAVDMPCTLIDRLIDDDYLLTDHAGDRQAVKIALEKFLADQVERQ